MQKILEAMTMRKVVILTGLAVFVVGAGVFYFGPAQMAEWITSLGSTAVGE